jgi:hypothetical protein
VPTKVSLTFTGYREILNSKIHLSMKLELKQDRKDRILAIAGYTLYGFNYKLQIHSITPLLLTHVTEFTISPLSLDC